MRCPARETGVVSAAGTLTAVAASSQRTGLRLTGPLRQLHWDSLARIRHERRTATNRLVCRLSSARDGAPNEPFALEVSSTSWPAATRRIVWIRQTVRW